MVRKMQSVRQLTVNALGRTLLGIRWRRGFGARRWTRALPRGSGDKAMLDQLIIGRALLAPRPTDLQRAGEFACAFERFKARLMFWRR